MVSKSKIGPKGRLTTPKELREKYHMREGEQDLLVPVEGVIIKRSAVTLRGRLRGKIDLSDFEENLREIRKQWRIARTRTSR